MKTCGAKTRKGTPCKKAGGPNGRCRMHGGASLIGPAHPGWKHGRYSKYLQADLGARYAEALRDPELVSVRAEIALIQARVMQLVQSIGETGSTKLWRSAIDAFTALQRAKNSPAEARVALQALETTLRSGLASAATWDELRETLELQRRLADSETKRERDLNLYLSNERALAILTSLVEAVKRHVTDPGALAAVSHEFRRLAGRPSGGQSDA